LLFVIPTWHVDAKLLQNFAIVNWKMACNMTSPSERAGRPEELHHPTAPKPRRFACIQRKHCFLSELMRSEPAAAVFAWVSAQPH